MRRGTCGRLAAILLLLALLAGACGSDNDEGSADSGGSSGGDGATTTAQPKSGGSITHGVYSETAGLDPVVATGGATTGNIEMAAIYDVLLRYNPDTGKYEGQTAESVEASADFTTWTLKLKPNIKFSDGTDYDADAVVFSMKRHTQFASRSAGLLSNVKSYDAVDKLTVKFTLNGPWPGFEYVLSTTPGLIPSPAAIKAACGENQETKPRDCSFNLKPVGAGPFVIDSYKPKDSITLRRNADYWGGQVYLDSLKFVNLNGAPPTYEAIKANTLQTGFLREPETIKKAQDEKSIGGVFVNKQWLGSVAVLNNGKVSCKGGQPAAVCGGKPDGVMEMSTPTADRRVRQAIAYALDPKVMDQRTYNGTGMPGSEFFQKGSKWQSSGSVSEYNPDKAKALVEEVKKEKGWDGSIRLNCHNAQSVAGWPIAVQAMLTAVGFKPQVKNDYDINGLVADVLVQKSFDIACYGFNVAEEAPEVAMQQVFTSTSPGNVANAQIPELDAAVKAVREAATEADKKAALETVQQIWKTEQPSIIWGAIPEAIAWNKNVHGLRMSSSTLVLFDKAWVG